MSTGDDSPAPRGRGPFWRVVQVVAGVALFLYALRELPPMPYDRGGFVLIAALLAAGAMAVTDSVVGVIAGLFQNSNKGDPS